MSPVANAHRYVAWLRRHAGAIIAGHILAFAAAVYLIAYHLPLYADSSYLLPQDVPAVRDLRKLEARVKTTDVVLVVVEAKTPAEREVVASAMAAGMRSIPHDLVLHVDADDRDTREFLRSHRELFVPLPDLERARDALHDKLTEAKLAANPLYVDLDDDRPVDADRGKRELDDLRKKRHEALDKLERPTNVSADGKVELIQARTGFRETDVSRGEELLAQLSRVRAAALAGHPDVQIGFTGGVVTTLSEHNAISRWIVMSSLVTAARVALVLALYFRSATLRVMLGGR